MKYISVVGLLLALSLGVNGGSKTPVMIGAVEGLDACLTLAHTVGSAGEVNVYLNPESKSAILERVKTGTFVMICDEKGEWLGVVYDREGDYSACGVSSPISSQQPYSGKCQSGWIKVSDVEPLAG